MKNPWPLSLAPLLLVLAVSSSLPALTAAVTMWRSLTVGFSAEGQSPVECIGDGVYAANSTYQANLRRLAAFLPAEVSATHDHHSETVVGYWPNRLLATASCRSRDDHGNVINGSGSACAACIAGAFLEVERACPYRKEASFYSPNCSLEIAHIRVFGTDGVGSISIFEGNILELALASGLLFQAIGFACLFFMQLQEWRSRRRGTLM